MDLQNTHGRDAVPLMMADEIFVPPPADDDELVFADATNLSNPLAAPLVASLRLIQKLKGEKGGFGGRSTRLSICCTRRTKNRPAGAREARAPRRAAMTTGTIGNRTSFDRLPGGGYAFTMIDDAVRIELRHLRRESRQLHAEVDVQAEWAGVRRHKKSLSCADLNLSSQSARKTLAKHCGERARTKGDEFDWLGAIDAACIEAIAAERDGTAPIVLDAPDIAEQNFEVHGFQFPVDSKSIVIAHGDSLKSLLMLLVLGTLAQRGHRVLYLDYEWTPERHAARKRRLFGPERLDNLRYLRCYAPLVVEVDSIRRYCDEHRIEFVGLDSVGLACDGKLADDDTAIRFNRALDLLPPSMSAAHVPKGSLGPDGKGDAIGPFGSVFFSNLCRASWLVKKQTGGSDDVVTIGFPREAERRRPASSRRH